MTADKIPLGEYIFRRLYGLGIRHIFGVPGDFNLNLLDHLDSVDGLHWIGTRNELNGAYAADGYARVRGLPGVLITTYGVGELSAINGIGGAVAEWVPIIHIVGMTARGVQKARLMIHHTLGEGVDHGIFREISKPVSAATAFLGDDATFTDEVDRVIEVCCKTKLPVYLYVPIDTPDILVDAGRLQTPLETAITNQGKEDVEDSIVDKIVDHLQKAQKPSVLVDLLTQRFGLTASVRELLSLTGLVGFTTPLAKSVIDETSENFGGLYMGSPTPSVETRDAIQSSDLVIIVGRFPSDSNTGGFAYTFSPEATVIALHPKYVSIGDKRWDDMSFVPIVQKLLDRVKSEKVTIHRWTKPVCIQNFFYYCFKPFSPKVPADNEQRQQPQQTSSNGITGPLRQAHFWQTFNPYLRENDCVIAEVGSSQFGTLDLKLPRNATYYTQIYYSCIGFTVGATLGTLVARREQGIDGRVILFVGDGSLQMTVQVN